MRRMLLLGAAVAVAVLALAAAASAQSFSNTVLRAPFPGVLPAGVTTNPANQSGDSEPAIDFGGPSHTMAVDGLGWLRLRSTCGRGTSATRRRHFSGRWTHSCRSRAMAA
jgi:hypothetical protein